MDFRFIDFALFIILAEMRTCVANICLGRADFPEYWLSLISLLRTLSPCRPPSYRTPTSFFSLFVAFFASPPLFYPAQQLFTPSATSLSSSHSKTPSTYTIVSMDTFNSFDFFQMLDLEPTGLEGGSSESQQCAALYPASEARNFHDSGPPVESERDRGGTYFCVIA